MNKMRCVCSVVICLFTSGMVCAGNPDSVQIKDKGISDFEVNCFQRPAFFHFDYRNLPAARALPKEYSDYSGDIEGNRLIDAALSLPVIFNDQFKLITQFKYKNEVLNLGETNYHKQAFNFKNVGILLGYQWFYDKDHFIAGHLGSSLKAEKHDLSYLKSILNYNGSIVWGVDNNHYTAGIGVILGNKLGRFKISPLVIYEKQLNNSWYLDAKLPKKATITKSLIHDNFYVYGSIEGEGATYFLNDHLMEDYDNIEFRRKSVDLKLGLEKEINDWLWGGLEIGVTQPINAVLVEQGLPTRKHIHDFKIGFTPFMNMSLFAVPPRALYKKFTK